MISLKAKALFMIYLIVTLAFFSSFVYARLDSTISGSQEIRRFVSEENDHIILKVWASSAVSFELENQDLVELPCTIDEETGEFYCEYIFDNTLPHGTYTFTLVQEDGIPSRIDGLLLYVDGRPPQILVNDEQAIVKNGDTISISYGLEEQSVESDCPGILRAEIYANDVLVHTETFGEEDCEVEKTAIFSLNDTEENVTFSISAFDRIFNMQESVIGTVFIDTKPPRIRDGFSIMNGDQEMNVVSTAARAPYTVDVVVEIEEASMPQVTGDLTEINTEPGRRTEYMAKEAVCIDKTAYWECHFPNTILDPSSGTITIRISAEDSQNNQEHKDITMIFDEVNRAGDIVFYGPKEEHCGEEDCYVKRGPNTIVMKIEDVGATFYDKHIRMMTPDMQEAVMPYLCNITGTEWECLATLSFGPAFVDGQAAALMLQSPSTDDQGNTLRGMIESQVIFDGTPPSNEMLPEASYPEGSQLTGDLVCPRNPQALKLNVAVFEETSPAVKIFAKTTNISSTSFHENDCREIAPHIFDCTLEIGNFVSYATDADLDVIIEDLAGNKLHLPYAIEVCEADLDTIPNYINGFTIPNFNEIVPIDKRIATFISFPVFLELQPNIASTNVQIVDVNAVSCIGTEHLSASDDARILNPLDLRGPFGDLTPSGILRVPIQARTANNVAEPFPDEIPINCSISFTMRVGNRVLTTPEIESIVLPNAQYQGIPTDDTTVELGVIDESIQSVINKEKERERDLRNKREFWERIEAWAARICGIAKLIGEANAVIQTMKAAIYGILAALSITGWGLSAAKSIWEYVGPALGGVHSIVQTFIWPPGDIVSNSAAYLGAQVAPPYNKARGGPILGPTVIGMGVKNLCQFWSCHIYDGSATLGGFMQGASTQLGTHLSDTYPWGSEGAIKKYDDYIEESKEDFKRNAEKKAEREHEEREKKYQEAYEENLKETNEQLDQELGDIQEEWDVRKEQMERIIQAFGRDPSHGFESRYDAYVEKSQQRVTRHAEITRERLLEQRDRDIAESQQEAQREVTFAVETDEYIIAESNELLGSPFDYSGWIIDPYRSKHMDGMCIPAVIYNLEKERQITCMYIKCLEHHAEAGLPTELCKEQHDELQCLYVEGAMWRKFGESWYKYLMAGTWNYLVSKIMPVAATVTYQWACNRYNKVFTDVVRHDKDFIAGPAAVGCGLAHTALSINEIIRTFRATTEGDFAVWRMQADRFDTDACEGI